MYNLCIMSTDAREKLGNEPSSSTREAQKSPEQKLKGDAEVSRGAKEVIASSESAESSEGAEFVDGNISEDASEDKSKASQTAAGGGKSDDEEKEERRAKLKASAPSKAAMIRELKGTLRREENKLSSDFDTYVGRAHKDAHQLTEVVRRMREVQAYFSTMAHASYEVVMKLWLKIVHGL